MTRFIVRDATVADAPGVAQAHWDSHQTTYVEPGLVRRDRVEGWSMRNRVLVWTANAAISEGIYPPPDGFHRMSLHVAVDDDGRVVGFACTSIDAEPDGPRPLQLEALYLLEEFHGTGAGQALLDAALGDRPAYLWALDVNPRAHAFYRRNGFELDGTTKFDDDWQITEVRFVR
ncbi:GNAT family N-acetyltransferase [Agromyces larvae]|uniref:GNAT family N-acetyltransferase n=1 Tax=Agromyces larvae TaxID=2929802 RepID=A0ABY4BWG9_9MICO|nr:GNAT family N-acetyltransferase [Agromyces larvae]UOE43537.1 GNAT family N-acetyltransferase [Agromyces larvae]